MILEAVELLECPHCGDRLVRGSGDLCCSRGHTFDLARQGYVSLLGGDAATGTADTAAMVDARARFLARGHYEPIADAVSDLAYDLAPITGCAVDLGAGTGYHLANLLERSPERIGLALDISKYACRRAGRSHPRVAAVVCDVWGRLPVRDAAAAAVISVFSPRHPAEIARVMREDGVLVVAVPTDRHLRELIGPLGLLDVDGRKQERLEQKLRSRFERVATRELEYSVELPHDGVRELVAMGPSAYHLDADSLPSVIAALPKPTAVTVSVTASAFRRSA